MKKFRKGFTLVELLIVVAIIGVLAATMTMSSTDAVDAAGANTILSNLNSLKTAAYQMYMDNTVEVGTPAVKVASATAIDFNTRAVGAALEGYLGKQANTIGITTGTSATGKYDVSYLLHSLSFQP